MTEDARRITLRSTLERRQRRPKVLLRDFTCPVCGAPRRTDARTLVALCPHCGTILAHGGDDRWRGVELAAEHRRAVESLVLPSAGQARMHTLTADLARLAQEEDRSRWRALAAEQMLLLSLLHPEHVAPIPPALHARAAWLSSAVALQEITTFDRRVAVAMHAFSTACASLTGPEPLTVARKMLASARAYYRALLAHRDFPPGALPEGAEHHARELVRRTVDGYASLLGAGTTERIRLEILGDHHAEAPACPKCGAPFEAGVTGLVRCVHCGAVSHLDDGDAWTAAQLAIFQIALAELTRRDDLDGIAPVLAAVGGFLHTAARDVPIARVVAFLERAIPWVSTENLHRGLTALSQVGTREQHELLGALIAATASWTADPSRRPVHVEPGPFPPPTEAEEAAWLEGALALVRLRGGGKTLPWIELAAQPLSTIQVAAVHETRAGVSPRAALAFFEAAHPSFDRAAIAAVLRGLRPGYDHPRVREFIDGTLALLEPHG